MHSTSRTLSERNWINHIVSTFRTTRFFELPTHFQLPIHCIASYTTGSLLTGPLSTIVLSHSLIHISLHLFTLTIPMSIFQRYSQLLARRPLVTNVLSTGFLFGAGDVLAQHIGIHHEPKLFDWARAQRAVIYGAIVFAPLGDKWYKLLARVNVGSKASSTVARVALDQCVFAPFIGIPLYYSVMTYMEGHADAAQHIETKLRTNWWKTLSTNWMVWPVVQTLNFGFVPLNLRLLVVNVVSIGWNCYLLMVMNDKGHLVEDVTEEQVLM